MKKPAVMSDAQQIRSLRHNIQVNEARLLRASGQERRELMKLIERQRDQLKELEERSPREPQD